MAARACLEELKRTAGYFFDPKLFCYCEDTDLVLRANLLGYQPHFVNEVLALHEGQASTSKGYNRFIAYHGIRNSTWVAIKLVPTSFLIRNAGWHALAHLLSIGHHASRGRFGLLRDVYRDLLKGFAAIRSDRLRIKVTTGSSGRSTLLKISDRFYRRGYLIEGLWRTLFIGRSS